MARTLPDAKLIVPLRNPVERAYSHYQHQVRSRTENLSFEDALASEKERIQGEAEKLLKDDRFRSAPSIEDILISRAESTPINWIWCFVFMPESRF
jgi:hypothetical protein